MNRVGLCSLQSLFCLQGCLEHGVRAEAPLQLQIPEAQAHDRDPAEWLQVPQFGWLLMLVSVVSFDLPICLVVCRISLEQL